MNIFKLLCSVRYNVIFSTLLHIVVVKIISVGVKYIISLNIFPFIITKKRMTIFTDNHPLNKFNLKIQFTIMEKRKLIRLVDAVGFEPTLYYAILMGVTSPTAQIG